MRSWRRVALFVTVETALVVGIYLWLARHQATSARLGGGLLALVLARLAAMLFLPGMILAHLGVAVWDRISDGNASQPPQR